MSAPIPKSMLGLIIFYIGWLSVCRNNIVNFIAHYVIVGGSFTSINYICYKDIYVFFLESRTAQVKALGMATKR